MRQFNYSMCFDTYNIDSYNLSAQGLNFSTNEVIEILRGSHEAHRALNGHSTLKARVLCGRPGDPWCHVVPRSQGGLGIEQNTVTLCPECHREYDQGPNRKSLYVRIVAYLKGFYPEWNQEDMIYRKGM